MRTVAVGQETGRSLGAQSLASAAWSICPSSAGGLHLSNAAMSHGSHRSWGSLFPTSVNANSSQKTNVEHRSGKPHFELIRHDVNLIGSKRDLQPAVALSARSPPVQRDDEISIGCDQCALYGKRL